ncbi:sulfotransferase family domain-containing protein [Ditylenchus destructor]|uniref:Sulfotransferase family domain-containing protein n=1 Tax=Ditylenchus destructor TaxID=166010 RepID=A0AAD4N111_9BILA|nr:sulfotransferase family domain-containing protein [Ditylenchus destructor]
MYFLYSLYFDYKNRPAASVWRSDGIASSLSLSLDSKPYECVNWTEVELREAPIAAGGQISGPELLNVSDFIKKHNKNVAAKSKTIACRIQKSMSTVLDAIACYLYDEKAFRECKYSNFSTNERLCRNRTDAVSLEDIVQSQNDTSFEHLFRDWNVFTVVRHPIDRLLSGFLDKCIGHPIYLDTNTEEDKFACYGCGANFTCFVIHQYHRLMTQSQHPHYRITNADLHFFPQNWRCEFDRFLANISIVKYSNPQTGKYNPDLFIDGLMKV